MVAGQIVNIVAYSPFNFKYQVKISKIDTYGIWAYYWIETDYNTVELCFNWEDISELNFTKSAV